MKKVTKQNKGFTLIEVIIYIALFSLLIGTAFVAVFDLVEGSQKLSAKIITEEEGNFAIRKISWALNGMSSFTNISNILHINKYDGSEIDIELVGKKIKMKEGAGLDNFITTDNVSVDSLVFLPTGGAVDGITANVTIDGINFSITKYIRQ